MSTLPYPTQSYPILPYHMGVSDVFPNLFVYPILPNLYVDFSIFSVSAACLSVHRTICFSCLRILFVYLFYQSCTYMSCIPLSVGSHSCLFCLQSSSYPSCPSCLSRLYCLSGPLSCLSYLPLLSASPVISFLYIPVYLSNGQSIYLCIWLFVYRIGLSELPVHCLGLSDRSIPFVYPIYSICLFYPAILLSWLSVVSYLIRLCVWLSIGVAFKISGPKSWIKMITGW